MIRMIIGYCYGIRSERRLCEEVHLNLAYRWFCRLGFEDAVPNQEIRLGTVSLRDSSASPSKYS
jgi:transposase